MATNTPSHRLIPDGEPRTPLTGWRVFSFQGRARQGGAMTPSRRLAPVNIPLAFRLGQRQIADGILTIYPRENSTQHPIGGHLYIGAQAYPFTGKVEGLRFDFEHSTPRGRPAKTARDVAVGMAYDSFVRAATRTVGEKRAKAFATRQCLELWQKWPGVQDASALRRARRNMQTELKGRNGVLITYNGTAPDMSDYVAVWLLPGATLQTTGGELHMHGPAWVWHWGAELAQHFECISAVAQTPSAADSDLETVGGQ